MESNSIYFVYSLSDKNGDVFYIGQTFKLKQRIYQHISEAKRSAKNKVINALEKDAKIINSNFNINYAVVKSVDCSHLSKEEAKRKMVELEEMYIKKYIKLGHKLCNKRGVRDGVVDVYLPTIKDKKTRTTLSEMSLRLINNKIEINNLSEIVGVSTQVIKRWMKVGSVMLTLRCIHLYIEEKFNIPIHKVLNINPQKI